MEDIWRKPWSRFLCIETQDPTEKVSRHVSCRNTKQSKSAYFKDLSELDGTIRIFKCTVALEWVWIAKSVCRILHSGPSKSIESYIQECGRTQRDGSKSRCFLLYNGFLQSNCAGDIREYVTSSKCRREMISNNLSQNNDAMGVIRGCKCCNICAENFNNDCKADPCTVSYYPFIQENSEGCEHIVKTQEISNEQMKLLSKDLQEYKVMSTLSILSNVNINYGDFHINQVLKHADKTFNYETLRKHAEIWKFLPMESKFWRSWVQSFQTSLFRFGSFIFGGRKWRQCMTRHCWWFWIGCS